MAAAQTEHLREFTVWGHRPLRDIGTEKTVVDSAALHENIAMSMADVLTYNTGIFVKNAGRATLSTVAFRGTSPSHTQVSWNGLRLNSPMLGMTDFSTIPAFFVDRATVLHGTTSVTESGGGFGGLINMGTEVDVPDGPAAQYVQGIGSFTTFDEFLRVSYGSQRWRLSTRVAVASSPNDFPYTNHDKKENIYDPEHNIVANYHPRERNRSGTYTDINILQDAVYTPSSADELKLAAWYTHSRRHLPVLTTDYGEADFLNRQLNKTLRTVASFSHRANFWKAGATLGWTHTEMAYDYRRELSAGNWAEMTRSRSTLNTVTAKIEGQYMPSRKWLFNASATLYQHFVRSIDKNTMLNAEGRDIVGYDKARPELTAALSARYQPITRLGLGLTLRQEVSARDAAPLIPAVFVDGLISRKGNVMAKASWSRNHRFPTLNDLYFIPGGNPSLRNEHGWTYDAGISFDKGLPTAFPASICGSATWFDSRISDWIIWLPTTKGFFSPRNLRDVHAYGVESRLDIAFEPVKKWLFDISATYSWTPSVNVGEALSDDDRAIGNQLPYVPKHSASLNGRLSWNNWTLGYRWVYYSRRMTMTSTDDSVSGHLPTYFMNNISLSKNLELKPLDLQLKLAVNNLFNEDYLSVLAHPMPGINFEFFISVTPHFTRKS